LTGMGVIAVVFSLLRSRLDSGAMETYELGADYLIGIMLVFFGGYFLLNADKYFDAEWSPKRATCSCHGHDDAETQSEHQHLMSAMEANNSSESASNWHVQGLRLRKAGSALVGFVQGIACPGGLVGMAFLKQYMHLEMLIFFITFFSTTILAMGSTAMLYGVLTQKYVSSSALARSIYCASCTLSLVLGIAWIALTATGKLDMLSMHTHDHGHVHNHGHHGNHGDHGDSLLAVFRMAL